MWEIAFVLPNLRLEAAVDEEFIALAPSTDARINEYAATNAAARELIGNFEDQFGNRRPISAIILRNDAPPQTKTLEALTSFRNLFAISCVLNGWQYQIGNPNVFLTLYSDFFDLYPWAPNRRKSDDLVLIGPALESVRKAKGFKGQTSPDLPAMGSLIKAAPDQTIFDALKSRWRRRFGGGSRKEWHTTALFRSLAVAYQASALPTKNVATIYDYGTTMGIWVSAFETLLHPRVGKVGLESVLRAFDRSSWLYPGLRHRRFKITYVGVAGRRQERVNRVKAFYYQLYKARNDFLHGNDVRLSKLLLNQNPKLLDLTKVAPLLYSVALHCVLDTSKMIKSKNPVARAFRKIDQRSQLERALLKVTIPLQ